MAKFMINFPVENFPSLKKYIKTTQKDRKKVLPYKGFSIETVERIKKVLEELPPK